MVKLFFPEERVLREVILPDLELGRKAFDRDHTEAVVYWTKELLKGSDLDAKVLVSAAYAHDWGYVGLFPEGTSYNQIQKMKPKHMKVGAEKIGKLLKERLNDLFTREQIERVEHLVGVHDKLGEVKDEDELLLVEADTLGALDVDRVKPTFSREDNDKYISEVKRKRRPLFVHSAAIEAFDRLVQKRISFYRD